MCYLGIHECTREERRDDTNRETTGEVPDLREKNLARIIAGVKSADKIKWMK